MVAVLVGAVVAVLFLIGFVAGGTVGETLAIFGKEVMYKAITLAAIGCLVGLIAFYVEGTHELKIDSNESSDEDIDESVGAESGSTTVKM